MFLCATLHANRRGIAVPAKALEHPEVYPQMKVTVAQGLVREIIDDTGNGTFLLHNVLTAAECDELLELSRNYAFISSGIGGRATSAKGNRESNSTHLPSGFLSTPLQRSLTARLQPHVGLPDHHFEPLQLTAYDYGGFYSYATQPPPEVTTLLC